MRRFHLFVGVYFIFYQTLYMSGAYAMPNYYVSIGGFPLYLYDFIIIIGLVFVIPKLITSLRYEKGSIKTIFLIILAYVIYQFLIILPLSIVYTNLSANNLLRRLSTRLDLLLIPYFYWFVLKNQNSFKILSLLLTISGFLIVVFVLPRLALGDLSQFEIGEQGRRQYRFLWGGTSLLFAYIFIRNILRENVTKRNIIIGFVSLIGIALAAHRSAFIALFIVIMLFIYKIRRTKKEIKDRNKLNLLSKLFFGLGTLVLIILTFPTLYQTFINRIFAIVSPTDTSYFARYIDYIQGARYFIEHPLNGGLLKDLYSKESNSMIIYQIHNFVLDLLVQEGIIGLSFYLILFYLLMKTALRNGDEISKQMFLMLSFYIIFNLFNTNLLDRWNILLFLFPASVILHQNKYIQKYENSLVHKYTLPSC